MFTAFSHNSQMNGQKAAVASGTQMASFCSGFAGGQFHCALTPILDTITVVSIFVFLGVEVFVRVAKLLAQTRFIILARADRAEAPERQLLTI